MQWFSLLLVQNIFLNFKPFTLSSGISARDKGTGYSPEWMERCWYNKSIYKTLGTEELSHHWTLLALYLLKYILAQLIWLTGCEARPTSKRAQSCFVPWWPNPPSDIYRPPLQCWDQQREAQTRRVNTWRGHQTWTCASKHHSDGKGTPWI